MLSERIRTLALADRLILVTPEASVFQVARSMQERACGAVVVVEGGVLVGIFTEHDAVCRVVAEGLDAHVVPVAQVMTRDPVSIDSNATLGQALVAMQQGGFSYLPVVEHGNPVGIVRARAALDPALEDFVCETRRRESFG